MTAMVIINPCWQFPGHDSDQFMENSSMKFFYNLLIFVQYRVVSQTDLLEKLVQSPVSEFADDKATFWKTHPNKLTIYRLINNVGHRPISGRVTKHIRMSFP